MTTAKPKPMAGQTDTADDLIAELARLMAEDAQSEKPKVEAKPVRIPGEPKPAVQPAPPVQPTPAPHFEPAPERAAPAASAPQVRIPGQASAPAAEARPMPFSFDRPVERSEAPARIEPVAAAPVVEPRAFPEPVAATRHEPAFAPQPQREPDVVERPVVEPHVSTAPLPALDQDSLADLIAAELASEIDAEVPIESPVIVPPEAEAPVRDNDVFGVPPVFGLGSAQPARPAAPVESPQMPAPAPVQPSIDDVIAEAQTVSVQPPVQAKAEPDPLDEIERLIGPAVRNDHRPQAPSPALRSLATPTLPVEPAAAAPASEKLRAPSVASVDEAILAAAATSGARVEWVEPEISARIADTEEEIAPRAKNNRVLGMTRSLAGPVVAMSLLAVAAVGLYAVLGLGSGGSDGPAPLLVADTAPIKEVPTPDPEASSASQSVVFNEIAGGNTGEGEQLVSRDQANSEDVNAFAPSGGTDEGLVNRKVRTVTVRPDGTIVSGSEGVAGATMLPVDRPNVPDVPGADFSTPELIGSVDPSATAAENAATATAAAAPTLVPVTPGSFVPAVDLAGNVIAGKTAPVPRQRPANLPTVAAAPAAQTPVAAPPQPAPAAAPAQPGVAVATGSSAPAYVQLSSQRSEEAARQTAQSIVSRFGPLFGGANLEVQRVDLGERGIFYRVRVPADSLQSANTLCNNVKAAGGDCFTM